MNIVCDVSEYTVHRGVMIIIIEKKYFRKVRGTRNKKVLKFFFVPESLTEKKVYRFGLSKYFP